MKKIKANGIPAFHGELSIRSVNTLPNSAVLTEECKREDGSQIVGHSESGHHHVTSGGVYYRDQNNPLLAYLVVKEPVALKHEKQSKDAHKPFELLSEGETVWEIGIGREKVPEGYQRSLD